jgi:type III secretion protein N (ATPase)
VTAGPFLGPGLLPRLRAGLAATVTRPPRGRVDRVLGPVVEAMIPGVRVGELCFIVEPGGREVPAEVIGLGGGRRAVLAPIGGTEGLSERAEVVATGDALLVPAGAGLLGRVLDGFGRPLDGAGPLADVAFVPAVGGGAPPPLSRPPLQHPLPTGLRVVDGLATCVEGQRIGIFGPPGTGKSSLVSSIVRGADADVVVVALIGERGWEVPHFLDRALGDERRRRSVVAAATSDRPPLELVKAALAATAAAEWFRDRGQRVLLLIDSVTRLVRALRTLGLAAGEPPTRRGYPPSVFAALPRLLERAGPAPAGSITAFYTVLLEGEMASDPVAEELKSLLDGHLILSRDLADAQRHPAIDPVESLSRAMGGAVSPRHLAAARKVRALLARHAQIELLVRVGEYRKGVDPFADEALDKVDAIKAFLAQSGEEGPAAFAATVSRLAEIAG